MFWPYLRDTDKMENKWDPKPKRDQQVFMQIGTYCEDNGPQLKKAKNIGKRPRESLRARFGEFEVAERLVERIDNIEYVVSLLYKMTKIKELRVSMDEIEVPTCIREEHGGVENESETESEDEREYIPPPLLDP